MRYLAACSVGRYEEAASRLVNCFKPAERLESLSAGPETLSAEPETPAMGPEALETENRRLALRFVAALEHTVPADVKALQDMTNRLRDLTAADEGTSLAAADYLQVCCTLQLAYFQGLNFGFEVLMTEYEV